MRTEIGARSTEGEFSERLLRFILKLGQGGPYMLMVHSIPDLLSGPIRRLPLLWQARASVPLSSDRPASRRAA